MSAYPYARSSPSLLSEFTQGLRLCHRKLTLHTQHLIQMAADLTIGNTTDSSVFGPELALLLESSFILPICSTHIYI